MEPERGGRGGTEHETRVGVGRGAQPEPMTQTPKTLGIGGGPGDRRALVRGGIARVGGNPLRSRGGYPLWFWLRELSVR